jgi:starch synthase
MTKSKKGQPATKQRSKVMYVTSEAYPLIKTGGLADVSHSLPNALHELGHDVRLVLPAYRSVLEKVEDLQLLGWLNLGADGDVRVVQAYHPEFAMPIWLVDAPAYFDREGNPYVNEDSNDWPDNPRRFTVFSRAAALLGVDALGIDWRPDVVHCNDWQSGLVHAFLSQELNPPRRIYTVHNLAYDCQFDYGEFQALKLPPHWWSMEHAEFYGSFSLMKAGLVFSDWINTVSPTYAKEICTAEYGYGYAGILQSYSYKLRGILNGIDTQTWDPASDPYLTAHYSADKKKLNNAKRRNRETLLKTLGATDAVATDDAPLIGSVGRLAFQKGVDLLLEAIPKVIRETQARFVVIGTGDKVLQQGLKEMAARYPERVFVHLGYSEEKAHLLEAGCDMFVMPSRYEPCGLNQLYSLRYGTIPVVRHTGGLADTVIDADAQSLQNGSASGFSFKPATAEALASALLRALEMYKDRDAWKQLQKNGMSQDLSWQSSAKRYLDLYSQPPVGQE